MIKICIVLSLLVAIAQSAAPDAPTAFAAKVGQTAGLTPVEGSTLTLTCTKAQSGGAITGYKWFKASGEVHTLASTDDTAVFTINTVASSDDGLYHCKTYNGNDLSPVSPTQNIAVVAKCATNIKIAAAADCGCVSETAVDLPQTANGGVNQVDKYCRLVGSTYSIETLETTECTENLKVAADAICRARAATTDGTKYCVTGQYKSGANACTTFPSDNTAGCIKGADTKCVTCSDSMLTHCGTCNPGYKTPAATACTVYPCTESTTTTGCKKCQAIADRTADSHCLSCNDGYEISGTTCAEKTASSSMSLGVQTAVLIGMMSFV